MLSTNLRIFLIASRLTFSFLILFSTTHRKQGKTQILMDSKCGAYDSAIIKTNVNFIYPIHVDVLRSFDTVHIEYFIDFVFFY